MSDEQVIKGETRIKMEDIIGEVIDEVNKLKKYGNDKVLRVTIDFKGTPCKDISSTIVKLIMELKGIGYSCIMVSRVSGIYEYEIRKI